MNLAPIAVFGYRRKAHLERTLRALEECVGFQESPVFIFLDGPREGSCQVEVADVRAMVRGWLLKHPNARVIASDVNRGLANSIIGGVSTLIQSHSKVIVVEDDLLFHPCALTWFNQGLDHYELEQRVFAVTAYQFRIPEYRHRRDGVLAPFASSWGWATWSRAWDQFDPLVVGWERLLTDKTFRKSFDLNNNFPMSEYLLSQLDGRHDSWASRWYWTLFKAKGLTLFPPRSLVRNIGNDETATHGGARLVKQFLPEIQPYFWEGGVTPTLPNKIESNFYDNAAFLRGLRRTGAMRNTQIKQNLRRFGITLG